MQDERRNCQLADRKRETRTKITNGERFLTIYSSSELSSYKTTYSTPVSEDATCSRVSCHTPESFDDMEGESGMSTIEMSESSEPISERVPVLVEAVPPITVPAVSWVDGTEVRSGAALGMMIEEDAREPSSETSAFSTVILQTRMSMCFKLHELLTLPKDFAQTGYHDRRSSGNMKRICREHRGPDLTSLVEG